MGFRPAKRARAPPHGLTPPVLTASPSLPERLRRVSNSASLYCFRSVRAVAHAQGAGKPIQRAKMLYNQILGLT